MKQIENSTFESISKAVSDDVANGCGGFKFKTNTVPTFCPECRSTRLIALDAGVYMCTACGNAVRTPLEEK